MKRTYLKFLTAMAAVAGCLVAASLPGQSIGQWDFNGNLSATVGGADMTFYDGPGGATDSATVFGTTTSFAIADIGGAPAQVMKFPASIGPMGYSMPTPPNPNGPSGLEGLVNDYTLIFDVLYPTSSAGKWRAFIQTDSPDNSSDADFFVNPAGGIGISGQYPGNVTPDVWHRIAFVVDGTTGVISKYIDGKSVGSQSSGTLDGRWALTPGATAPILTDNDSDNAAGYVNSIQIRDSVLNAGQIAALGLPGAAGIPQIVPPVPAFVESRNPAADATNVRPDQPIQVSLNPGDSTIVGGSVKLVVNGTPVVADVTAGASYDVAYVAPAFWAPAAVETVSLIYEEQGKGKSTNTWSFTIANYKNITLPAPIAFEDFNGVAEGEYPAGWTVTNKTETANSGYDIHNVRSDAFLDWQVISRETLISIPSDSRLGIVPVVVNGVLLDTLVEGNLAYAESDIRSGSQVQALFSPDFNCSGKNDIFVCYYSTYEQNQDSIGSVEYSVDEGQIWQPVVYMIDQDDIIRDGTGKVDAVATLNTPRGDGAYGLSYGNWIGAEITPALAPFISGRINDDPIESKRVELFRIPGADNQPKVRFRFMQAGTASWYFAIDNFGLYSIATPIPPEFTSQPQSTLVSPGAKVEFSATATGSAPLNFQWYLNDQLLDGKTSPTLTINSATAGDVGDYKVTVSNAEGTITSVPAHLDVYAGALTAGLVVHLKFDDDWDDTSGHDNHAAPVNAPEFSLGKIGTSALHLPSGADYVTLGTPADLNFGTDTDFSIAFWAKVTAWNEDPAFIGNKNWNSGGNPGYVLATDGDAHFQWNLAGSPGGRKDYDGPAGLFADQNWHHVVVTFARRASASTYIDGALANVKPLNASANNVDTPAGLATNIGQDGTGSYGPRFADAEMDDLGIWRRTLTPQEAGAIYSAGLTGKDLSQASVGAPVVPPSITAQPVSKSATEGTAATFTVAAAGTPPLHYQWKHGSDLIPTGTEATLTIKPVTPAAAGTYTVVVSNDQGDTATSNPVTLTVLPAPPILVTGQWDFNAGDLRATIGQDLEYRGDTAATTSFVDGTIGGQPVKVMAFPATTPSQGFIMHHGAAANGDGAYVNRYTILMDVMFPAASNNKWRALLQTSTSNGNDGDFFVNSGNGIGISGQYQGRILPETWHRVVFSFNLNESLLSKYIDGILVNRQTLSSGVDGRFSLDTIALLFADEDGETAAGFVNSIQFRNGVMTDEEVAALGSPTAAGLPAPGAGRAGAVEVINWTDGTAPFLVERKSGLSDANWTKLMTSSTKSALVAIQGASGFFRISDKAQTMVTPLTAYLDGASEKPNAINTPATGVATFSLEGNKLWYYVTYENLSANATAAHIHGPANSSTAAGVMVGLGTPTGTSGVLIGVLTLTEPQKADVLAGKTYVNVHTAANPGGEIRGQISVSIMKVSLNGANERPTPVVTPATGTGTLTRVGNKVWYNINYSGLSADATSSHLHGPADSSTAAGVLIGLNGAVGTSGSLSGVITLNAAQLGALVDGFTYVNIHTGTNPGGEIRGQITP